MEFLKDLSIDKVRNLAEDAFNQAKPKTDVEARVYEVLSHKNWGASSSLMHEVARDTFDAERFIVVTRLMWEGMENQRPAAWKVVFKALTLLEFLVKNGAERCVDDARNHGHVLRALGQFNYYEGTIDRGLGVREKSKQIMEILADDDRIREERQKARKLRQKFGSSGATAAGGGGQYAGYGNQDSWNAGGGYGQSGIESSPYEGRYKGSRGGDSSATPTFAAMPSEGKPKKTKKKKKKPEQDATPPAPAPEIDLFSFDDPTPAPAPAAPANDDFGAFQDTSAPAANDDFGAFVASKTATQPDPFAAPASAAASFDAFGNNNNNNVNFNDVPPQNNIMGGNMNGTPMGNMGGNINGAPTGNMGGNMNNMTNAFGNMNMGGGNMNRSMGQAQQQTSQQQMEFPMGNGYSDGGDDDFGDFAAAGPKSQPKAMSNPADPLSKLVSLDGLSKNPSKNPPNQSQNMGPGMGGIDSPQNNNPGMQQVGPPSVVSAGGRDAISSLMGPPPAGNMQGMGGMAQGNKNMQQQQQQGIYGQQSNMQQGQGMMNSQMQGGFQGNMMMQGGMQAGFNPQMGNQMGGFPQSSQNMMGNQMGGFQQGGNMMGNQMGGFQQGGNMMANQMGGFQQGNMMGGQQFR